MADIRASRNHSLDEPELRSHLETLANEMREKFGIRSDFQGNVVRFSGSTVKSGEVTWTADRLTIELSFGFLGKVFKNQIADEIEKRLDAITAS